jgi:hypothetical protein
MLTLARESQRRGGQPTDLLREILHNSRANPDFYNGARAIIELANVKGLTVPLNDDERERLVGAYSFLYNERLYSLFDRCHDALWRIFERDNDTANLLNLFRHSSFIWRLTGRDEQEIKYLRKLMRNVHDMLERGLSQANRDGAYFIVRVSVVMGDLQTIASHAPS